jgi:hypothetical protein
MGVQPTYMFENVHDKMLKRECLNDLIVEKFGAMVKLLICGYLWEVWKGLACFEQYRDG